MSTTLPSFNRTTSIVPPYRTNIPSHQHTAPPYRTTAPPYRTTVPYHHIIVPTHCTTVPYHLTTVPYHRTVPYIIVPTHRTYLTLPIQPESRLHLLWQFIIYNSPCQQTYASDLQVGLWGVLVGFLDFRLLLITLIHHCPGLLIHGRWDSSTQKP